MGTPSEAEEWSTGPWGVVRQLRLIRESLAALKHSGNTPVGPVGRTFDDRLSVRLFPGNAIDGMLFKNITAEVHMRAGVTVESLKHDRARFYKQPDHDGRVVLVLGAGNIAAIAPMDVITKMFNEGKVVLLKMNPVNAYLGPYIEQAFAEAIKQSFLSVVYGGAEEGRYLVYHRDIDEVHITGSDKTYDNIVWGPEGPEREMRRQRHEPLLKKPITSELGNVSPFIIVPGPYSEKELQYQAEDTAASYLINASFLCCAAKMLVLPKDWAGSDAFMQALQETCAKVPRRQAYYPGAEDRWRKLTSGRSRIKHLGNAIPGALPWSFISGLDPNAVDEPLYTEEPFCSVISETRVGNADPVEYLERAVEFCNDKLWGTLNANLIVHPYSLKDPRINEAVERAITEVALRSDRGQRLHRHAVRICRTAVGRVSRVNSGGRSKRQRLRAQHFYVGRRRENGAARAANHIPQARLLRKSPHHSQDAAQNRSNGRKRPLGKGPGYHLRCYAWLVMSAQAAAPQRYPVPGYF
jgi:hypothetical protein